MSKVKVSDSVTEIQDILLRPVGEPSNKAKVKITLDYADKLVSDDDIILALCSAYTMMIAHNDSLITKEEFIKRHHAANPNTNYDYNKLPDFINIDSDPQLKLVE